MPDDYGRRVEVRETYAEIAGNCLTLSDFTATKTVIEQIATDASGFTHKQPICGRGVDTTLDNVNTLLMMAQKYFFDNMKADEE